MLGAIQAPDETGLSDWVRADAGCRELLLVRFGAHYPAYVGARIVGVAQGRTVEGPWPVIPAVGAGRLCLPGTGSLWMSVLGCELRCADSREVPTRTDASSCADPVRVADAAPLCGRSRPMVAGTTVAEIWRRTGSPSPVTRAMTAARTAAFQLQRRAARRDPWFRGTRNRDVPAATALAMHATVGCRIDPWRCCGLESDCAVANR